MSAEIEYWPHALAVLEPFLTHTAEKQMTSEFFLTSGLRLQ